MCLYSEIYQNIFVTNPGYLACLALNVIILIKLIIRLDII